MENETSLKRKDSDGVAQRRRYKKNVNASDVLSQPYNDANGTLSSPSSQPYHIKD